MTEDKKTQDEEKLTFLERLALEGVVHTTKASTFLERVERWSYESSLWPLPLGSSCCSLEYISAFSSQYRLMDKGLEFGSFDPEQADLMIVGGTITHKLAPVIKRLYETMPSPKWVIAMGACACSGGIYPAYNVIEGLEKIIPVDVYIPGCPPTPEALLAGIEKIKERIRLGVCLSPRMDAQIQGDHHV